MFNNVFGIPGFICWYDETGRAMSKSVLWDLNIKQSVELVGVASETYLPLIYKHKS